MNQQSSDIDEGDYLYCSKFVIDKSPYCFWDFDPQKRNLDFLEGLTPEYFDFVGHTYKESLSDDETRNFAAIGLRTSYFQALETMFAILFAAIQAPHYVPGWLSQCWPRHLKSLVDKIDNRKPIYSIHHGYKSITWQTISETVFSGIALEDSHRKADVERHFGKMWAKFGQDFTDEKNWKEYNSIKHGFRVKPGGFSLSMGLEDVPGIPAPKENMCLLGSSVFGSSFLTPERVSDKNHFRLRRQSLNWDPEDLIYGLSLISMSLTNIISFVRLWNGANPDDVRFHWLKDEELYREPWKRRKSLGVWSMSWSEHMIDESEITKFDEQSIYAIYERQDSRE